MSSPTADPAALRKEMARLKAELQDLQIMYENTVEHGTLIENELEDRNRKIARLLGLMKMYMPSQLYDSIAGGRQSATLTHKRAKLTMFFSDIVGFTDVTDTLEPETLSALLNEYLTEMSTIAGVYGGTLDKFIGDAIVIFFGDPQFIDDETHAQRCVRMAVEMLEKVELLSEKWRSAGSPHGLGVRIGINTGYCTVGNFGSETRMDYTMIGGQVNIAARLEKIADRNSIFISESTYALVRNLVEVEGPQTIEVKGIHVPVKVYKVVGMRTEGGRPPSLYEELGDGFLLRQLYFEPASFSATARERIVADLERALRFLKGT